MTHKNSPIIELEISDEQWDALEAGITELFDRTGMPQESLVLGLLTYASHVADTLADAHCDEYRLAFRRQVNDVCNMFFPL